MKILISNLPENPWWGHGTPLYENNPAMREGVVPDQELVEIEIFLLKNLFQFLPFEILELDFPYILDQHNFNLRKHDFVFVRDLFISNQKGDIIISKFRERERQIEADIMQVILDAMGYQTKRIPEEEPAYAEGGEFYYCPKENILFTGISRNNQRGSELVAEMLGVSEMLMIKTAAFHLDTIFTPVMNRAGDTVAVIAALEIMDTTSQKELQQYCRKKNMELIDVPPEDAIGTSRVLGDFATNCLPLPGYLIGPSRFRSPNIVPLLASLDVKHITIPTTQFRLSGGAIHCLTNEL
ncbi:MAG: arginine deiminase-related protein [Fidelibacterota bacterium]